MANLPPVVISGGQLEQLQAGDSLVAAGPNAPGSITLADGQFMIFAQRITLTGAQRLTAAGAAHVRVV